ncbi:polymorphic toxin-type HINT domain-containing protein [Streptomyces sp. NPDC059255]|uniref:polymorphic toxin-type HINT domain-containing protein n=1 Tax=Streptomyces sp. NPDC059255 TaxID=3346793 RepID=UPI0036792D63
MNGRQGSRFRPLRRRVALASSVVMVATLLQGVVQPALAVSDEGMAGVALPASERAVPGSPGEVRPRAAMKGPRTPEERPGDAWPKAASVRVRLPEPSTARATGSGAVAVPGAPLSLAAPEEKKGRVARGEVEVRVLDRAASEKAGVDGPLFTLRSVRTEGSVRTQVDYSSFGQAYGGGYSSRLRLVELPACVLSTPSAAKCRTGKTLPASHDAERNTLTADSVSLTSAEATVLAIQADAEGDKGSYKATSLSPSGAWNTNLNTGDFTWSYALPAAEVPGGLKPSVGLSYSSGGVDGRTANTNNQSSWVGDGFDLSPGFIERRYKPCADDGVENADGNKPGDQCWGYDNAFISFNGKGGELVPAGDDKWKLKDDDGTLIEHRKSTNRGNGDNDGEFWQLTDPAGIRYYFGFNRLPNWVEGNEETDSTWTVPVYGNDTGEPCHASAFADSWCQQAWRWNLDYVVDTRSNAVAYYYDKEANSYGRNLKEDDNTRYTRGGYLDRIEYGLKSSAMYTAKALGKMNFTSSERCLANTQTTCGSIGTDAAYWYDTPWDLNCDTGEKCDEGRLSPAFFTRKRLTGVDSQVWDGSAYQKVDSWKIGHRWGMADTDYQLLLDSVQHTGHTASPAITLPKTTFAYTQLANRLDKTGDGYAPFIKSRLSSIDDESGGQVSVNYSDAACDWNALPTPQSNSTRCFPQYVGGSTTEDPTLQWFNKYVVASVTSTDRTGGAPDQVARYQYLGAAAWHYDDDDGLTEEKQKTWSQWRGYGQVRVQTGGQGGAAAMKSQTDTFFLRGMDGDRKDTKGGTKSVSVALDTGEGDAITDHRSAAGFAYKNVTYSGPSGKILTKTVNRPWHHETAKKVRDWGTVTANFTGSAGSKVWTSLDDGAGAEWRTTSSSTTYDTVAGRPVRTDDSGDQATSADDRCTTIAYATNTEKNILTLPSRVEVVAKPCAADASRPADVVSDVRTAYDGAAYDVPPAKGDTTATAQLKTYNGTTAVYLETGSTFDSYGRVATSTDLTADVSVTAAGAVTRTARADGRTTVTARTPATGFATSVRVTSPPAVAGDTATAQTSVTTHEILRGQPLTQTDTNGGVTSFAYDALGRSTKVWLADQRTSQTPAYEFTYSVDEGRPVVVGTKLLGNRGVQRTSYTIHDGLLRERQAQVPGPDGGRIITDNFYDERGLLAKSFAPYYTTGKPAAGKPFEPDNALSVETQTRSTFDGLGRPTETRQIAGNGDGGTVLATTRTTYGGDRVTVIPPVGATTTTTLTDARGKTTELRQHQQRSADSAYNSLTYTYTNRDELSEFTDTAGNKWTYSYDLLGRQTRSADPDKGATTSTYDDRGQLTSTKDARNTTLAYVYDGLGRKTELREGSTTGTLRAKWAYDTISGAKGQPSESTRYVGGEAYTSKVVAYDRLYRVLRSSTTIPTTENGLGGTYLSTNSYNVAGDVEGVGYPKAGALSAATVAYTYEDDTQRPVATTGSAEGVKSEVSYSYTGKPLQYRFPGIAGKQTQVTNTYEWGTQRLSTARVDRLNVAGVDQYSTFRYDEAGNVLAVSDVARGGNDTQCFAYDHLRRMTEAWAQGQSSCAAQPSSSALGGPAPYWNSYAYDQVGNRRSETVHDAGGNSAKDVKRTYAYPAPGTAQPHTLTSVTSTGPTGTAQDTFTYDKTGSTATRTLSGDKQTLTWDAEGRLTKVTQPVEGAADKVTEYLYDADGNRLIGRTPEGTTLYLGGTEIVLPKGASTPKATRYFDLGGGHQAIQENDGKVSLTIADHHGTAQLAVDATSHQLMQRRTLPFGGTRGTQPATWPGTKGFVGGTADTSTGLTHLGAREYDPTTGRFLSADPIMDLTDSQQINGYAYSGNNPLTWSDPSGLCYADMCGIGYAIGGTGQVPGDPTRYVTDDSGAKARYEVGSGGSGGGGKSGGGGGGQSSTNRQGSSGSSSQQPVIAGVRVPTQEELFARGHGGAYPDASYSQMLVSWAGEQCQGNVTGDLCSTLHELGWVKPTADFLELVGVRDAQRCAKGSVSGCVWTVAGLLPVGKIGKAAKLLKQGDHAAAAKLGPCNSFLPDTEVLLAGGKRKKIADVKIGDKVIATDPETGRTVTKTVTAEIIGKGLKNLVRITVDLDGEKGSRTASVTATAGHPFWVPELAEWIDAADLHTGQQLRTSTGDRVRIAGIKRWTEYKTVHNLTVTDLHTYYVLASKTPVLVHNTGGKGHMCDITAMAPDGTKRVDVKLESGNMTPEEAALGYPNDVAFTHTEHRFSRMAGASTGPKVSLPNDPFLGNYLLSPGDAVTMRGQLPPCSRCKGAMNRMVRELGVSVTYKWDGAKGAGTWNARG